MLQQSENDQNHVFPEVDPNSVSSRSTYTPRVSEVPSPENVPNTGITPGATFISSESGYPNQPPITHDTPEAPAIPGQIDGFHQPQAIPVPPVSPSAYSPDSYSSFDIGNIQPADDQVPKQAKKSVFDTKKITDWVIKKWWLVLLVVVGVSVASLGIYSFINRPTPEVRPYKNVAAKIEGPQSSPSGSPAAWKVTVQNKENVAIQNVVVNLNFDRTFRFTRAINPNPSKPDGTEYQIARLDALGQGSSDIILQFEGVLTGNIDEEIIMSGTVTYTPSPLIGQADNRRSVSIEASRTRITAPEIKLDFTTNEQTIQNGGEVETTLIFENTSERELQNLRIRMVYPDKGAYTYKSSELVGTDTTDTKTTPDDGNNIWNVSTLPRLKRQTLRVKGNIFGADGVPLTFGAKVEIRTQNNEYQVLAETTRRVTIAAQPLVISTRIEGVDANKNFRPGDSLTFIVEYQNRSNVTLRDVEILSFVEDPANLLDYSTFRSVGGDRGLVTNRTIQWRGNTVPQLVNLSPQVKGQVSYTIQVVSGEVFAKSNLNQANFTLIPKASARAVNLQQVEFAGDLYKAAGILQFFQDIKQKSVDPTNLNRVTYTVTWTFRSRQSQVNEVIVKSISPLPITAWNQNSITPESRANQLNYNPASGEIIWQPGRVPAYTGVGDTAGLTISFDLTVDIDTNSSDSRVVLFSSPNISGVDDFTGEKYSLTGQTGTATRPSAADFEF